MQHQPDPAYLEHLEWQLRSALRRRSRFAGPAGTASRGGALRTLAVAVLSLVGGAGAVLASERLQDVRDREALVSRARLELELAELDLEGAREALARTTELCDQGAVSVADVARGEHAAVSRGTRVACRRLDLEEVGLSGLAPRDDLAAPRVAGRDFVGERLALSARDAESALAPLREASTRVQVLARSGLVDARETADAERAVSEGERAARLLRDRLALRVEFLRGTLAERELAARERLLDVEADLARARDALSRATGEAERARALADVGAVTQDEARERDRERRRCAGRVELAELERARWERRARGEGR